MAKKANKPAASGGTDGSSPIDRVAITATFEKETPRFKALLDEVVFILETELAKSPIKLHGIEKRVKKLESIIEKCERNNCTDPFAKFDDIVAARVICLFKEDIEAVGALIAKVFDVIRVDDKRTAENAPLGYLSVHYTCKMPKAYKGPRYDNTSNIQFEIQIRTLCMHCWAQVSHHLDYKGDWDVPKELKMALSALSGLFYVADNEFHQFYAARLASKEIAEASAPVPTLEFEINLDTLAAYLASKYPDRKRATLADISDLVLELKNGGYRLISEIDLDLTRSEKAFAAYEAQNPPFGEKFFSDVGVVRGALTIVSDRYRKSRDLNSPSRWENFSHLVDNS